MKKEQNISVSADHDGRSLVPDQPVHLQAGKKYHLIIEDILPDELQKGSDPDNLPISETAFMSDYSHI